MASVYLSLHEGIFDFVILRLNLNFMIKTLLTGTIEF